jgi:peptidoglycan hydrolase-like protein with peptidoglycan-binding domain
MLKIRNAGAKVEMLQQDLKKLGYNIKADGVFGLNTLRAVRKFQEKSDIAIDGIVGHFTQMAIFNALNLVEVRRPSSEHFKYDEFISNSDIDAKKNGIPSKYWSNLQTLMERLEIVRKAVGDMPIVIRSGYRSPDYNKKVGGAKRSQHLYGKAVDIYVKGREISCYMLAKKIYDDENLRKLFGGFGLGSDTNLHIDIRHKSNPLRPSRWWYRKKSWKEWARSI